MTSWLPVLSALIVASAVLAGFLATDRTHRRALAAAEERGRAAQETARRSMELASDAAERRERDSWRRDSVLSSVTTLLEAASQVRHDLADAPEWDLVTPEEIDRLSARLHRRIWEQPGAVLTRLRVLAHRRISAKCEDLLHTLTAAQNITVQRLKLQIDPEATGEEIEQMLLLWEKAILHAAEQERAVVEVARAELGIEVPKQPAQLELVRESA